MRYPLRSRIALTSAGVLLGCVVSFVSTADAQTFLSAPWSSQDIGSPATTGSVAEAAGIFTVKGAGTNIWGQADQFQFVYQLLTGDGDIVARVQSLEAVDAWSLAGVMMRESLAGGSKHASMFTSGSRGLLAQHRRRTDANTARTSGEKTPAPYWVRLERRGDVFSAYDSPDGLKWTAVGSATIAMLDTIYVGLAVTSHDAAEAATAVLSNVVVHDTTTTNKLPAVSLTSPSNGAAFYAPGSITLAASASDPDGSIAKVAFYAGTTLIGSDTTSPYTVTWSNAAPGTYSLTAVATDNAGARSTSAAVSVTVKPSQAVFAASSDHDSVTSYRLDIFAAGADPSAAVPIATGNVGKPMPVNGEITVDITSTLQTLSPGTYFATVSAISSAGSSRSAPSANFTR